MAIQKLTFKQAFDLVFAARPLVQLNDGFVRQLKQLEQQQQVSIMSNDCGNTEEDKDNDNENNSNDTLKTDQIDLSKGRVTTRSSRSVKKINYQVDSDDEEGSKKNAKKKNTNKRPNKKETMVKKTAQQTKAKDGDGCHGNAKLHAEQNGIQIEASQMENQNQVKSDNDKPINHQESNINTIANTENENLKAKLPNANTKSNSEDENIKSELTNGEG